jgi:hypothetical protein
MSEVCMTLIPYDKREGIPLNVAAERAANRQGRSATGASNTALGGVSVEVNGSSARSRWRCILMGTMRRYAGTRAATGQATAWSPTSEEKGWKGC